LTDVQNDEKDYFNEDMLKTFALTNSALSVNDFNLKLMEQIEAFKGKRDYPDDFTVLTSKFFKKIN